MDERTNSKKLLAILGLMALWIGVVAICFGSFFASLFLLALIAKLVFGPSVVDGMAFAVVAIFVALGVMFYVVELIKRNVWLADLRDKLHR